MIVYLQYINRLISCYLTQLQALYDSLSPLGKKIDKKISIEKESITVKSFLDDISKIFAYENKREKITKERIGFYYKNNFRSLKEGFLIIMGAVLFVCFIIFGILIEFVSWAILSRIILIIIASSLLIYLFALLYNYIKEIPQNKLSEYFIKVKKQKDTLPKNTKMKYEFGKLQSFFYEFLYPLLKIIEEDSLPKQKFSISYNLNKKESQKHINSEKKDVKGLEGKNGYKYSRTSFYDVPIFSLSGTLIDGTKISLSVSEYIRSRYFAKWTGRKSKSKAKKKSKMLYKIKLQIPKKPTISISEEDLKIPFGENKFNIEEGESHYKINLSKIKLSQNPSDTDFPKHTVFVKILGNIYKNIKAK